LINVDKCRGRCARRAANQRVLACLAGLASTLAAFELAHALLLVAALDRDPVVEALELARQIGNRLVGLLELGRELLGDRLGGGGDVRPDRNGGGADRAIHALARCRGYAARALGAQALAQPV